MNVFEVAEEFSGRILSREDEAMRQLQSVFLTFQRNLLLALDDLLREVKDLRNQGQPIRRSTLSRLARFRTLLAQVEAELRSFGQVLEGGVQERRRLAVLDGLDNARTLIRESLGEEAARIIGTFDRAPIEAAQRLLGALTTGPLHDLIADIAPDATRAVKDALTQGILQGKNPRVIARELRKVSRIPLRRAELISRTEVLRAYRSATLTTYRENEDVVDGWIWVAKLGSRTCPVCIALHGTFHPLTERFFGSHPACRCTAVPKTKGWADLGIEGVEETRPEIESGESWFARQPAAYQEGLLGPGKYALYRDGKITLADLVGEKTSPKWGPSKYEIPLKDLAVQN